MRNSTLAVGIAVCLLAGSHVLADSTGDILFLIGQKSLEDSETEPVDSGFAFGAIMTFGQTEWPVGIAVDALGYADYEDEPGADIAAVTLEGAVGVRKIWTLGNTRPYVGAGIGLVAAAVKVDYDSSFFDDDEGTGGGLGPWAGGGVFWRLGSHFDIGLDARWNQVEVDLDFDEEGTIEDVNVGGVSFGLTLGVGW